MDLNMNIIMNQTGFEHEHCTKDMSFKITFEKTKPNTFDQFNHEDHMHMIMH